jgi:long-chain acyl-CoA synthetase
MLYERWREIAQKYRRELALRDFPSGRQWTFAELDRLAEAAPALDAPIVCPQGHSPDFIVAVLRAWKALAVLCPLEPGQLRPAVPPPPAPCVHLKTTSATTGTPHVVAFTPEQLAADADNIVASMGLHPDSPNLGLISLAHSYGFSNLVLPLLLHGVPLILAPSPLPEMLRRAAAGHSPLTLAAVPALWRAWHEAGAIPANVRLAISAGAPLPLALERAVHEATGLKIHNFYGSSECGGIAFDTSPVPRAHDSCVGSPMQNVQVALDENGCVEVRSRAVGQTYWPEPEDTLGEGRFRTTDLGEVREGWVFLRGRLSDQINVAGRKVLPAGIERVLASHTAVRECLVFGVPSRDTDRAEVIVACISTAAPVTAGDLKQFLLAKLPAWQVPREWCFVPSLEANLRGKVPRAEWRRRFLAGEIDRAVAPSKTSV